MRCCTGQWLHSTASHQKLRELDSSCRDRSSRWSLLADVCSHLRHGITSPLRGTGANPPHYFQGVACVVFPLTKDALPQYMRPSQAYLIEYTFVMVNQFSMRTFEPGVLFFNCQQARFLPTRSRHFSMSTPRDGTPGVSGFCVRAPVFHAGRIGFRAVSLPSPDESPGE